MGRNQAVFKEKEESTFEFQIFIFGLFLMVLINAPLAFVPSSLQYCYISYLDPAKDVSS